MLCLKGLSSQVISAKDYVMFKSSTWRILEIEEKYIIITLHYIELCFPKYLKIIYIWIRKCYLGPLTKNIFIKSFGDLISPNFCYLAFVCYQFSYLYGFIISFTWLASMYFVRLFNSMLSVSNNINLAAIFGTLFRCFCLPWEQDNQYTRWPKQKQRQV